MRVWRSAAILWMVIVLACAAFVGLRFARSAPVESDFMALLPPTERNANAEAAVKALSERIGNRVVLLVGHPDAAKARELARNLAGSLKDSGAFNRIIDTAPKFDADRIVQTFLPHRAALLTRADRAQLENPTFNPEAYLLKRLHQAFPVGMQTSPDVDPFGFLQHWLSSLPLAQGSVSIEDGLLLAREGGTTYVMILAEPGGNAFDSGIQSRVVAAVGSAEAAMHRKEAQAVLLRTGGLFYGEAARSSAEAEVDLIGGGSLVGILLLMWLLFRSFLPLALGSLTVAAGIACGAAAVLAAQGKIHLLTLVFGASLIGEAVDYSIQYFTAHLAQGDKWEARSGLRQVLPGLAVALATSLIGYGTLSLTPFPAVSQIALFAFVGLSAAWITVALVLPGFVQKPVQRDLDGAIALPRRILEQWRHRATPGGVLWLAAALLAISAPGWMQLAARDDIRLLVSRPAQLVEQENVIRHLAGVGASGRFFLVEGATDEGALQAAEALADRLRPLVGKGISGYSSIADFVPSRLSQERNRRLLAQVLPPRHTSALLEAQGFRESVGTAWHDALEDAARPLTLASWGNSALAPAFQHLILSQSGPGCALLVTLSGDQGSLDLPALAAGLPGVTAVDKAGSVSRLFARYRDLGTLWLPVAMAMIWAILAYRYGPRSGSAVLFPTLLAMAISLGIYGYLGVPLTLFTLMGLVLVLGVGVNYAIFVVEAGDRAPAPFAGVLLSAATTMLSFGLLSLSSMPALHQFGLVLLGGIVFSVLLAPMALTLGKRSCG